MTGVGAEYPALAALAEAPGGCQSQFPTCHMKAEGSPGQKEPLANYTATGK